AEPVVTNCLFEGNSATGIGGGASFDDSDPEISHNLFSNNYGGLGGGFGILRSNPSRVVSNNLVTSNEALFYGGGIACIRSNTVFTNNTIVNNLSMSGGGFYCNDSAVPTLYNTILVSNEGLGHEVYIWDVRSAPSFYYCNVEDGTAAFEGSGAHEGYLGTFENNLDTVPMFRGTGDFPFALQAESPCIDAGTPDTLGLLIPATDLEGRNRIYNGRIDIGAYEWNPGEGIAPSQAKSADINACPNPAKDEVTFVINTPVTQRGDLRIISIQGIVIHEETGIRLFPGNNRIIWDLTDDSGRRVRPGLYFCRIAGSSCSLIVQ
ncbi:MAG TPA: choice-of-anchor Q domain-containing protein, partial [Bacteroidales bacterium]|nr:choice-of-anchor Q domain-containing protein [Bacteroidales bacterium]